MNAPERIVDWTAANQRLLVGEFSRLKQRLAAESERESLDLACQSLRAAMPTPAAIDRLTGLLGLSAFERDVLLLCAGVEMDAELAAACERAAGDSGARGATFGVAMAALDAPHWSAITPVRPLRRWRLVEVDDSPGLTRGRLRIDERILHYLAGANYLDARLRSLLRPAAPTATMAATHFAIADEVRLAIQAGIQGEASVVWLIGDDTPARGDVAAHVAAALGLGLQVLQAQDVPAGHAEIEALATLWEREGMLLGSALLVDSGAEALPPLAARLIERLRCLVFASSSQPRLLERSTLRFTVDMPDPIEQQQLWRQALGASATRLNGALGEIASQFKLSARTIQVEAARLSGALATSDRPERLMWSACRAIGRSKLDELAQRIESGAGWSDLIVNEAQRATLHEIGAHVRNRLKVHLEWGFAERGSRGLGISALFAGESGTGKTLAAEVLAHELQLDLYRIDLSAVVSKYIGETEKNLRRIFDGAEDSGAILLFDEADALFGKRSEVKDSHDRYANIEVSYLLQRMESYRGLAILTTNLKGSLDVAFLRRLRFIVHFSFPDQTLREAMWRNAFPARTPLGEIDYGKLARLGVTGGSIRNIALNAAFSATEQEQPVSMLHLLHAARHEAGKRERPVSDAETRGWA